MVLIFSYSRDSSTDDVIDCIINSGKKFIRINEDDFVDFINSVTFDEGGFNIKFCFKGKNITFNQITAVWFRRHNYRIRQEVVNASYISDNKEVKLDKVVANSLQKNLNAEFEILRDFIFYTLSMNKIVLGNYIENYENKLINLSLAISVGLKVPRSYVGRSPSDFKVDRTVVTKCLSYSPTFFIKEFSAPVMSYTSVVDEPIEDSNLCHSLYQEKIEKRIELRIFYLNGNFYTMAIFSQLNSQTSIDFRMYDRARPNRRVPYDLPIEIEAKLKKLLDICKLNTASIDMIVTPKEDYVFLEINPVGQFGMVSAPCHYNLERKIADFLIS